MASEFIEIKKYSLKKIINLPDCLTFTNLTIGLLIIFASIEKYFLAAVLLMPLAIVADFFDGKIAKLLHKRTEFGKEIDSLADIVSFAVAPGVFCYVYYINITNSSSILLVIAIILLTLAGLIRLARYNLLNYQHGFIGMPITANALLIPIFYFLSLPVWILPVLLIASSLLMISSIKIKRII